MAAFQDAVPSRNSLELLLSKLTYYETGMGAGGRETRSGEWKRAAKPIGRIAGERGVLRGIPVVCTASVFYIFFKLNGKLK